MKLLALDCSTAACSVAVLNDDHIEERYQLAPREHAQLIVPMIEECLVAANLRLADLDALAFIAGPGSFTGLRIAASSIQALAYAADLPVVAISSLRCLAQSAYRLYGARQVLAAIDARMHEVYFGAYQWNQNDIMQPVCDDGLFAPEQCLAITGDNWHAIGSGWDNYKNLQQHYSKQVQQIHEQHFPHAVDAAKLAAHDFAAGLVVPVEQVMPVYIRNSVTHGATARATDG